MSELNVNPGSFIGFSANKTEEQAKADTTSNRMTICKEKVLYMNGQRLGLTEYEAKYLDMKLKEEFASRIQIKILYANTGGGVDDHTYDADGRVFKPMNLSIEVSYDGRLTDADVTPTIHADGNSGLTLTRVSTGCYTCTVTPKLGFFQISVTARVNGSVKAIRRNLSSYHKIHYGVSALDALSGSIPSDFKTRGPQSNAAGTYGFVFGANTYGFILVPKDVSLPASMQGDKPNGVEGPLPVPFVKLTDLVVNGVTYTQLRIASKQAASTHNVKFA